MAEMRIGHYDDVSYQMNTEGQGSSEIDLLELLYYLIEHLKYIITAAVLGGVIALLYTIYFITPQYSATAKLYVMSNSDSVDIGNDITIDSGVFSYMSYASSPYAITLPNSLTAITLLASYKIPSCDLDIFICLVPRSIPKSL